MCIPLLESMAKSDFEINFDLSVHLLPGKQPCNEKINNFYLQNFDELSEQVKI